MAEDWSINPYEYDPNDQRFERKFVTDAMSAPDLDTMLRVHPSSFVIAYPDRWINNIYLDTDNLNCFHDHIRGCRTRGKFRIRWYGDLLQEKARPVLEIKRKIGMVGSKLRFDLPEFNSAENFNDEALKNLIKSADIDERITAWADSMRCVVGNRYRRTYFVTSDQKYRMTIDRNLQFMKIPNWQGQKIETVDENTIVLELKYQNQLDKRVDEITQLLPLRVSRMSKYILGVEQLNAAGQW